MVMYTHGSVCVYIHIHLRVHMCACACTPCRVETGKILVRLLNNE